MAETKDKAAEQSPQPTRGPAREDPRFTRPPNTQPGYETRSVCGYGPDGRSRVFNLLAKEQLPDDWSDAPPKGTHPNQQPG